MPTTALHSHGRHRAVELGGDHLDTPVRDIMTPGVVSVPEDSSLTQVLRALWVHNVHAVLVVDSQNGHPLGWITAHGLLGWLGKDVGLAHARDAITERVRAIEAGAPAADALQALSQPDTTHLLVRRGRDPVPEGVVSAMNLVALERG